MKRGAGAKNCLVFLKNGLEGVNVTEDSTPVNPPRKAYFPTLAKSRKTIIEGLPTAVNWPVKARVPDF